LDEQHDLTSFNQDLYNPVMSGIEWKRITPQQLVEDIENSVKIQKENKYAYQVGLKDLDFDLDYEKLQALNLPVPFQSIAQAEQALCSQAIRPAKLIEEDDTEHTVLIFDYRPVGYSGFMNCVIHSLALTNQGLFEVGRYSALNSYSLERYWQWFLHRRLACPEEVDAILVEDDLTIEHFMNESYRLLTANNG
jgi:hypothetical protein